jgi:hypothetical protein
MTSTSEEQTRMALPLLLLKSAEGRGVAKTFRAYRAPAAGAGAPEIRRVSSSCVLSAAIFLASWSHGFLLCIGNDAYGRNLRPAADFPRS